MVGFLCLAQNLQISFNIFPVWASTHVNRHVFDKTGKTFFAVAPTPKDWSGSTKLFYKRSHPRHNIKYCDIVAANPRKPVQLRRYQVRITRAGNSGFWPQSVRILGFSCTPTKSCLRLWNSKWRESRYC